MNAYSKSPKQFSEFHCISLPTFFRLVRTGKLEARKIGRRTIVTADAERKWLESLPRAGGYVPSNQPLGDDGAK